MRLGSLLVVGVVAAALAGCVSTRPNDGVGAVAPPPTGARGGGAASQPIAGGLGGRERRRAQEAEFQALEYGRPGTPVDWRGDRVGYRGEVVPGPRYRINAYDCRD